VLTTFVIGLREGLEAALIVGIIAAFLIRNRGRAALRPMWWGVAAAVALSAGAAVILEAAGRALSFQARETMEGILAVVAAAGVTYMIIWMRRHSPGLRSDLEAKTGRALAVGSVGALAGMAFIAVIREGLETAIFLLAALGSTNDALAGSTGAAAGILVAVGLGYGIYRGGIQINLARFFRITGLVLVVVSAGLIATAVHSLAEAGVIGVWQHPAVDLSWLIAPGTVRSSLLTAFLGFQPVPTYAEIAAWMVFIVPMAVYVGRPRPRRLAPLPV
jgi:high-affinity iron transporter